MFHRPLLVVLALLLAASALATPARAQSPTPPTAPPRAFPSPTEVLVGLQSPTPRATLENILARAEAAEATARVDATTVETLVDGGGDLAVLQVDLRPGADPLDAVARLGQLPGVAWAAPNWVYTYDPLELTPNDPSYGSQYHHPLMEIDDAWDAFTTTAPGAGVLFGIADNGVLITHPDLAPNLWTNPNDPVGGGDNDGNGYVDDINGWDFVSNDNNPTHVATDDHGSHVAGIAAARTNNAVGVAGVAGGNGAQAGARLLPMRFYGTDGGFTSAIIVKTFIYTIDMAEANNLRPVINNSSNIDGIVDDQAVIAALDTMYARGGLFFNSAGNTSTKDPVRQVFEQMLLVANTTSTDVRSTSSSYGDGIDIAAPGTGILSTVPTYTNATGYASFSGTSMASPNAGAVAALIWSRFPTYTRDQVAATLVASADNIDAQNPTFVGQLGAGRANARRALAEAVPPPRVGAIAGLPAEGGTLTDIITSFALRLRHILDAATVVPGSFELRSAGLDGSFGTSDDLLLPLTINAGRPYRIGTNRLTFGFDNILPPGDYRFTIRAAGLRDPFGQPLDGNGDGTGGDDLVRNFRIAYPLSGALFEDWDGDGAYDSGEPALGTSAGALYFDQDGDGQRDQSSLEQAATGLPLSIPDNNTSGRSSQITLGDTAYINDLDVAVGVSHTWIGDILLQLTGPDGTVVILDNHRGGSGNNLTGTIFDDEATTALAAGSAPFTGRFRPDEPLSAFDGKLANGTWTIQAFDNVSGDTGSLLSWSLRLSLGERTASQSEAGRFAFSPLNPGAYTLAVAPAAGWRATGVAPRPLNRPDTSTFLSENMGLVRQSAIYGYAYEDADEDGARDPGEAGLAGVTLFLDSDGDGVQDPGEPAAVSDAAGRYRLDSLAPGSATLHQAPPAGRRATGPAQGHPVTLAAGETLFAKDFGSVADTQAPTATMSVAVTPQGAATATITFTEAVTGFDIGDLALRRDGGPLALTGATLSGSGAGYTLNIPAQLAAAAGAYELRLTASGAGIVDSAGNALAADATASWARAAAQRSLFLPLALRGP